jgi:hypothetical protein
MIDRAADLYRRAVQASEKPGSGREHEARGLAIAARETARAVERLRDVQRGDRPADPDLPPPPRRYRLRGDRATVTPIPPIPPELPDGHPVPPVPPVPPRAARVFVGPDGKVETKSFIFVTPHGDVLKDGDGKAIRKFEVRVDEKGVRELEARVREQAERIAKEARGQAGIARKQANQAREEAARAQAEAFGLAYETARSLAQARARSRGGPGEARAELQKAYDAIRKAREESRGDEAKFYLDAARDLYNAARRDAEAGRNDRAVELARAAEALTHVPAHLGALKEGEEQDEGDRPRGDRPARKERRIFERRIQGQGPREHPRRDQEDDDNDDGDVQGKEQIEIRIQRKPEAAAREEAEQAEEKVAGIGVALKVEDGKVIVLKVLPESPAGQDGRLKADDELVGVVGDNGEKTKFADKELAEIVKLLRGPAGSKVRLLVRPAGDEETTEYELTRAELKVPQGALEPVREEADRAVREALRQLERFQGADRPADAGELPPPLPE